MRFLNLIFEIFWGSVDWFIPDHAKTEIKGRIKAQLTTAMLLIVIPFHIGPIGKFIALNSPVVYVNFAHMFIAGILLVVMKATGRHRLVAAILLITLFLQEAISVYFTNGLDSNVVGLILVIPVAGILLVGYRTGIALFLLLTAFFLGLYTLEITGHAFPRYDIDATTLLREKFYYMGAVLMAYTLVAMVFQVIKTNTLRSQRNAEENSRRMAENIQQVIRQIVKNSTAVATTAEELSTTSAEMQKNAEQISISETQTAASTNESAGTIQELSASLKDISKRMQSLNRRADIAEDEGQQGSTIIADSNRMMSQIEEGSKQIEQVTLIITDIAEQTNLLSLNAAIEADKAGDYGKGFAVVAEEVGELAERSNEAAQRISELIEQSDISVQEGKEIIDRSGRILEEIIEQVQKIALQVSEMVASVSEQDIGTREVAKGAEEISTKSDHNMKLISDLVTKIKNSNAAIKDLSQVAEKLDEQISMHRA